MYIQPPRLTRIVHSQVRNATAGPKWFDLPKTSPNSEVKRDLQLLRMRKVLEPYRHYKREGPKFNIPEFSQIGNVVQGPTEFYSARLLKRDRSSTIAAGVLAQETSSGRFKDKYSRVQLSRSSGKKAHYKTLTVKRSTVKRSRA